MPDYKGALKLKDIRRVVDEKKDEKNKTEALNGDVSSELEGHAEGD